MLSDLQLDVLPISTINLEVSSSGTLMCTVTGGRQVYLLAKRLFDIVAAAAALLLLAPVLLLIALLIKLDSSGPVFFVQQRVGTRWRRRDGRIAWEPITFSFYKFRSMHVNADSSVHQAYMQAFITGATDAETGTEKAAFKLKADRRITRVGQLLRQTSLDELPQLINILKGEMSFVGPRPAIPYECAEYLLWHHMRLAAPQGLTGLWQVKGRSRVSFDEMVKLDIQYIEQQSLWTDWKILFLTIPAVLLGLGAR